MTLQERIEAARKVAWQQKSFHDGLTNAGHAWDDCEKAACQMLKAAFPELFAERPTHELVEIITYLQFGDDC